MRKCVRTFRCYQATSAREFYKNTHISACPNTHTHRADGRIQCQAVVRQYLCSSAPWRAASPESPWAPSLWTAPSSALSSPAAPASPEPARCQSPLWAGPAHTHTHTHIWVYTHRDVQKKGRAGSGERESDVGYLRASRWSDSKPHWKCVTAALCAAAHSSEAEHRAKSWLLRHDSFQAYYHLCGAFYLWRCLYLLAAPKLPQDLETWTWI